jgi:hypothetical protein
VWSSPVTGGRSAHSARALTGRVTAVRVRRCRRACGQCVVYRALACHRRRTPCVLTIGQQGVTTPVPEIRCVIDRCSPFQRPRSRRRRAGPLTREWLTLVLGPMVTASSRRSVSFFESGSSGATVNHRGRRQLQVARERGRLHRRLDCRSGAICARRLDQRPADRCPERARRGHEGRTAGLGSSGTDRSDGRLEGAIRTIFLARKLAGLPARPFVCVLVQPRLGCLLGRGWAGPDTGTRLGCQ